MNKLIKYETPKIEVTRFDIEKSVMTDFGGDGGDGDIVTDFFGTSEPEGGPTTPVFDFDWE